MRELTHGFRTDGRLLSAAMRIINRLSRSHESTETKIKCGCRIVSGFVINKTFIVDEKQPDVSSAAIMFVFDFVDVVVGSEMR